MQEEKDPRYGNGRVYYYAPCRRASNFPGMVYCAEPETKCVGS